MSQDKANSTSGLAKAFLFVPANRPERFIKALETGAHILVDLEDAVGLIDKPAARQSIIQNLVPLFEKFGDRILLRMNSLSTDQASLDLDLIKTLPLKALIHPKTESSEQLDLISTYLSSDSYIIPMIESAKGIDQLRSIASHPKTIRLTLGNIDLQADLGLRCDSTESELQGLRFQMTVLSRLFDLAPPIDGVTVDLQNEAQLLVDLQRARGIGFLGKLCLHPKQIPTTLQFFQPSQDEVLRAQSIVEAFEKAQGGAVQLDGKMIDRPVFLLAQRLLNSIKKD
jgi:citrate lyase subunit beta / citryl-CoA lyase